MTAADLPLAVLDVALVVAVVRCGGALAVRIREPRIAGEMAGAILVGPTVLGGQIHGVVRGAAASGVTGDVFAAGPVDVLTWLGALGMILYMLLVGLTIDPTRVRARMRTILGIVVAMVGAMVLLTLAVAPWLASAGGWKGPHATSLAFLLALGGALAAHGVPIAARILEERGLLGSEVGRIVIATGAGVTTLALVAAGAAIQGGDGAALARLALVLGAGGALVAAVAPIARSDRMALEPRPAVAVLLAIALAAGIAGRQLVGTVQIGPLVVGIAARNGGFSARWLEARLGRLVRGVLLPIFLGVAALHVNLRELHLDALPLVAAVVAAVVVAKTAGAYASGRAAGFDRREAAALGALLQCGGVMTIAISLDVLRAGIITTRTHALLTLVGLVTTLVAGPLLARSGLAAGEPVAAGAGSA